MSIYNLTRKVNELARAYVEENMTEVDPTSMGIDKRACYKMWRCVDAIAIPESQRRTFDYYGGGEYVEADSVHRMGDYVFYDANDDRVAGWLGLHEEEFEE